MALPPTYEALFTFTVELIHSTYVANIFPLLSRAKRVTKPAGDPFSPEIRKRIEFIELAAQRGSTHFVSRVYVREFEKAAQDRCLS